MTHDDNLFLLPDPSQPPPGVTNGGSTWIQTETGDFTFDKKYSSQVFHLDLSLSRNTYDSLHYLDYNGVNYTGEWRWQLGDRLTGTLGADREETLGSYSQNMAYGTPYLITHTGETFTLNWAVSGPWHIVGGLSHDQESTPAVFTQVGSYSQEGVQFGVSYVSQKLNSATLQVRESNGTFNRTLDYVNLLDNGYKESEIDVITHLVAGAWTSVDTRIGYLDRRYDNFGQRDYSGWVGRVELNWQPSARIAFKLVASRDLVSYEASASSYYWLNVVSVGPAWDITSKLRLEGSVGLSWQTFAGAIVSATDESDRIANARLALDYKPTLNSSISLYATLSQRRSNIPTSVYQDKTFGMTATLSF